MISIKYIADKLNVTIEGIYLFFKHKNIVIINKPEYELTTELYNLLIDDYLRYYKKKLTPKEYEIINKNVSELKTYHENFTNISMPIKRLGKVATELNVEINTLIEFLSANGYEDINRNSKLSHKMHDMLHNEFAVIHKAEKASIKTIQFIHSNNEDIRLDKANLVLNKKENEINLEEIQSRAAVDLSEETKNYEKTAMHNFEQYLKPERPNFLTDTTSSKLINEDLNSDSNRNSTLNKSNELLIKNANNVDNIDDVKQLLKSEKYSRFKLTAVYIVGYYLKIINASYKELTVEQVCQILIYIRIYKTESFTEHWQVNKYISKHNLWNYFSELRSLNDHGHTNKIKGITPLYFALICRVLEINADDGEPLLDYEKY